MGCGQRAEVVSLSAVSCPQSPPEGIRPLLSVLSLWTGAGPRLEGGLHRTDRHGDSSDIFFLPLPLLHRHELCSSPASMSPSGVWSSADDSYQLHSTGGKHRLTRSEQRGEKEVCPRHIFSLLRTCARDPIPPVKSTTSQRSAPVTERSGRALVSSHHEISAEALSRPPPLQPSKSFSSQCGFVVCSPCCSRRPHASTLCACSDSGGGAERGPARRSEPAEEEVHHLLIHAHHSTYCVLHHPLPPVLLLHLPVQMRVSPPRVPRHERCAHVEEMAQGEKRA